MAKITIISSLFNCAPFLEEALLSGVGQSFKEFDWIIIDDGSTDNTRIKLEELFSELNTTVLLINDGLNKGIARRYNEALTLVGSDYACLLDGDDISEPTRLREQFNVLESNPEYWLVGCKPLIIDEKSLLNLEKTSWYDNHIPCSNEEIVRTIVETRQNSIIHPSVMFRVKDFFQLGGYNDDEKLCPDLDLWCKAIKKKKLMYNLPKHLIRYRIHSNNLSGKNGEQMDLDRIRIINKYFGE